MFLVLSFPGSWPPSQEVELIRQSIETGRVVIVWADSTGMGRRCGAAFAIGELPSHQARLPNSRLLQTVTRQNR